MVYFINRLIYADLFWIYNSELYNYIRKRCRKLSERIAVGSESFITMTKKKIAIEEKGREVIGGDGS